MSGSSLADRLGGYASLEAVADTFYIKISTDEELAPFLEGVDTRELRSKQVLLLKHAFGGLESGSGKHVANELSQMVKNKGMGLHHFDLLAGHIADTLQALNVPDDLTEEVITVVATARSTFDPASSAVDASGTGAMKPSLSDRLGGEEALTAVVDKFYDRILEDPELLPFFEGVDTARLRRMQVVFVKYAFGGAKSYSGKSLEAAHVPLIKNKGLNLGHFDLVAGHFAATMQELQVPEDLQAEALAVIGSTRPLFDPARYLNV